MPPGGDVEEDRSPLRQNNGEDAEGGGEDKEAARKERREQLRHLEKEAFQLANYYFVFQGVIFTGFYHAPSQIKCNYRWIPFVLSILAGFLNFCALSRIALSYKSMLDDADADAGDSIAVKCARWWRCFNFFACVFVVLAFLAVTLAGCWLITCGGGGDAAAPLSPDPE